MFIFLRLIENFKVAIEHMNNSIRESQTCMDQPLVKKIEDINGKTQSILYIPFVIILYHLDIASSNTLALMIL